MVKGPKFLQGNSSMDGPITYTIQRVCTRAELTAGVNLIPVGYSNQIQPIDYLVATTGSYDNITAFELCNTSNAEQIVTIALANFSGVHKPGIGTHTEGVGFAAATPGPLTIQRGVRARVTGTAPTAGNAVLVRFTWMFA
jgi:hypothetical protein